MIYIITALYSEAQIFIGQYHLKKNVANTRFQEFFREEEQIRLIISGPGEIAAAAAVASLCTLYPPSERDWLFHAGVCAGAQTGEIFLCHKLIEETTGKTFYPDLLYRYGLPESAITTAAKIREESVGAGLIDLEACAVYQAGSYFFQTHRMLFVKVVSDNGNPKQVTAEQISRYMQAHRERFVQIISMLNEITDQEQKEPPMQEERIRQLSGDLHCSKAMEDSLRQYLRYACLAGIDAHGVIRQMYQSGLLPCAGKKEGKQRFEELKKRLL